MFDSISAGNETYRYIVRRYINVSNRNNIDQRADVGHLGVGNDNDFDEIYVWRALVPRSPARASVESR